METSLIKESNNKIRIICPNHLSIPNIETVKNYLIFFRTDDNVFKWSMMKSKFRFPREIEIFSLIEKKFLPPIILGVNLVKSDYVVSDGSNLYLCHCYFDSGILSLLSLTDDSITNIQLPKPSSDMSLVKSRISHTIDFSTNTIYYLIKNNTENGTFIQFHSFDLITKVGKIEFFLTYIDILTADISLENQWVIFATNEEGIVVFNFSGKIVFNIGGDSKTYKIDHWNRLGLSTFCPISNKRLLVRYCEILLLFDDRGHCISRYNTTFTPTKIIFNWSTGAIIYRSDYDVTIIKPNTWISTIFWELGNIINFPIQVRKIIETFTTIRTICTDNIISFLPNEILFEIFRYLLPED